MTFEHSTSFQIPEQYYAAIFEALPGNSILVKTDAPKFTVLAATPAYITNAGFAEKALIGKGVFEAFPANSTDPKYKGDRDLLTSFQHVLQHKEPHFLPLQRYDLQNDDGSFTEKYWSASNKPVFAPDGEVVYIIHTAEDISELIKAEKRDEAHQELQSAFLKVEESEAALQQFKFMADNAQDPFILMREDGTFAYLNRKALEAWGYTEEEAGHIRVPDVDTIYQDEAFSEVFARAQKGAVLQFETLHRRKDGLVYPVEVNMNGILLNGIPHMFAVARDITERKKAEEALHISEERQSFLLKLSDRIRSLTNAGEIQFAAACMLGEHFGANRVGYAEDAGDGETIFVTRNYTNGVPGIEGRYRYDDYGPHLLQEFRAGRTVVCNTIADNETLSAAEKKAHAMLQIGSSINVPLLKDGRLLGVMFMHCAEAHSWSDQEVALIQETADRTWEAVERSRTEAALRESEDRFRTMVNAVPQSIWITDAEGRTEFLNKHWCDYCGEPYSHTTAADISVKYLHPEDGPKVMQAFGEGMKTGAPWEVEQRNLSKEGEYRWFLNRAAPYKDPNTGQVLKWFGVGVDIHDRKLAEQALRKSEEELERKVEDRTRELAKANEELRRSNQNLEEFAYAASHDLKEPIRKIHFFSDRLKERLGSKLEDEDRRYFERMELGTKRMTSLIDDLLLYSHVSRGIRSGETVNLNHTLSFVLDDLELHIEEKGAKIDVGPLPTIMGQQRQLQQLFENLIGNALKYSKPDVPSQIKITSGIVKGKETALSLEDEGDKQYHLIEVRDNGIGFRQEDAERIFNVFTRLHGMAEYKGTGVGLSIAKKVVENHGGYIWAESAPGEGAVFKVLLPAE